MGKSQTVSITALVIAVQKGSEASFEKLYTATVAHAYRIASLFLDNQSDIEDVVQNSYILVYKNIRSLKTPESFENWLGVIVKNECRKYIIKNGKLRNLSISKEFIDSENTVEPDSTIDFFDKQNVVETVGNVVNKLSPDKRACVIMFYFEQLTIPEISQALGIPEGTVKSRLFNARKKLTREFEKIQKKDSSLFGFTFIPFVREYFTQKSKKIVLPYSLSDALSASIAVAEITSAATTGASTTIFAAGGVTVSTPVITKIAAVAVAATFATGGGIAAVNHMNSAKEPSAVSTTIREEYTTAKKYYDITEAAPSTTRRNNIPVPTDREESSSSRTTTPAVSGTMRESTTQRATSTTTRRPSTTRSPASSSTTAPRTTARQTTAAQTTDTYTPGTTARQTTAAATATTAATTTTTTTTTTTVPTTEASPYTLTGGVLMSYTGTDSNVSIPQRIDSADVTAIGAAAFSGNENIVSVSMPSGVSRIGQEAFSECINLSSVNLPSSLQSIGNGSFYGCVSLNSVNIPSGTTSIGDDAFYNCTSLASVTIPSSVTSIGDNVFGGCTSLTVRCTEDSFAHDYAVANSINFVLI
ncbi:MAG: sigma-70 family RNA polymerase sigma factor [Clostridia bacterium]|nr:sigma-70 family RNA polymerase sigma factor [Clostridia bacterium]